MNERIKQLAIEAKLMVSTYTGELTESEQKFAELIVRECAQIGEDVDGNQTTKNEILKHFGVEK